MAEELVPAEQFLYATLSGDAQMRAAAPGGFHSETMPDGAAVGHVAILWSYQGSLPDVMGEQAVRIITQPLYLVRAILKTGDFADLSAAATRLDTLLHNAGPYSLANGYMMRHSERERPYSRSERVVDVEWRHVGGYYRLLMMKS